MRERILAFAVAVALILMFGCAGQQTAEIKKTYNCTDGSFAMNESDCPNTEVAEPALKTYACPDGKNVTSIADCKKDEPADQPRVLTDVEKRTLQIERVNSITGMINFDRQSLLNVAADSETATTQGCRGYYGYYQLILKRSDANYAAYMDELEKLAALFGENQTCKDTVTEGKTLMAETWKDAYLKSAVVLALCSEPQSKREWDYDHQAGETFSNSTARMRDRLYGLDRSLAANCERTYGAVNPAHGVSQ